MDPECIVQSEISHRERQKDVMYDFYYVWILKKQHMNKYNKTETESQIQRIACQREGVWRMSKIGEGD